MTLAIAFTTSKTHQYFRPPMILAGLCVLKVIEPQLFQKAKSGALKMEEAFNAFQFSRWPNNAEREWASKWWQYALDENLDMRNDEWQQLAAAMRGSVRREDIVRAVAEDVMDRMQLPGN
jgi:hypothetical protein